MKKLAAVLVVFFLVAAVCTGISQNRYYNSLPLVSVQEAAPGNLREHFETEAVVEFDYLQNDIKAPCMLSNIEILVSPGETVEAGDPIFQVSPDNFYVYERQLRLEILEYERESASSDGTEEERLRAEIAAYHLAETQQELVNLETILQNDGIITASSAGTVTNCISNGSTAAQGQTIVQMRTYGETATLIWSWPEESADYFEPGDTVSVPLTIWSDQADPPITKRAYFDLAINRKYYSGTENAARFEVELTPELLGGPLAMMNGERATILVDYVSDNEYERVLPIDAVVFDSSGSGFLYQLDTRSRVFGQEYYAVPTAVQIEGRTQEYVAVSSIPDKPVILNAESLSGDIEQAVRLR